MSDRFDGRNWHWTSVSPITSFRKSKTHFRNLLHGSYINHWVTPCITTLLQCTFLRTLFKIFWISHMVKRHPVKRAISAMFDRNTAGQCVENKIHVKTNFCSDSCKSWYPSTSPSVDAQVSELFQSVGCSRGESVPSNSMCKACFQKVEKLLKLESSDSSIPYFFKQTLPLNSSRTVRSSEWNKCRSWLANAYVWIIADDSQNNVYITITKPSYTLLQSAINVGKAWWARSCDV